MYIIGTSRKGEYLKNCRRVALDRDVLDKKAVHFRNNHVTNLCHFHDGFLTT